MRTLSHPRRGITLVEMLVTTVLIGVLGLIVFSLLNVGTILGAKNTSINVAHAQARSTMLQMKKNLQAAVSPLQLVDATGTPLPLVGGAINNGPAAGVSFQLLVSGPLRVVADAAQNSSVVTVNTAGGPVPLVGQRLIMRNFGIEADISSVTGPPGAQMLALVDNQGQPYRLPVPIAGSAANFITALITQRSSYIVVNNTLRWSGPDTANTFVVLGNNITNPAPFTTPTIGAVGGNLRFVATVDLSASDPAYSNRGFKSTSILLSSRIPTRAQLTNGL